MSIINRVYGLYVHQQLSMAERRLPVALPHVWKALEKSRSQGGVTHARQAMRLLELDRLVAYYRPESVLELGGGTTTALFAQALRPRVTGEPHLVTIEEEGKWEAVTRSLVPEEHRDGVDFRVCPRVVENWNGADVVRYDMSYDRYYDMVYVDGPTGHDPKNPKPRHRLPGVDVLSLMRAGFLPRVIVVDGRDTNVAFYRKSGIERDYRLRLRSERLPWPRRLISRYRYHTVFERR